MSSSQAPTQSGNSLMYLNHQTQHGNVTRQVMRAIAPVTPAKRPDAEVDDVQFISSKPVKRQKVDHPASSPVVNTIMPIQQPDLQPVSQSQPVPRMNCGGSLITPVAAAPIADNDMSWPNSEINHSHDRRITTGMVGLPSGFSDWESIFGYRGCSLPELESYSMSAARLKPSILSSPDISPKQIPKMVASADSQPGLPPSESNDMLQYNQTPRPNPNPTSTAVMSTPASHEIAQPSATVPTIVQQKETMGIVEGCPEKVAESTPPMPHQSPRDSKPNQIQQQQTPSEQPTSTTDNPTQPHASKQSCMACMQMQQRAAFARAQGLPFFNPNMPLHMLPPGSYHPSFGPQPHPQFMPAMHAGLHGFGPGFSPMMMPMNTQAYSGPVMSSPTLSHQHAVQPMSPRPTTAAAAQHRQQTEKTPETGLDNAADPGGNWLNQSTVAAAAAAAPPTTAAGSESPAKRSRPPLPLPLPLPPPQQHPSLAQPTYRKPSPNLIVDVAETCQENFPFAEVARRHDTTVEKVADVFTALVQVPLLRCPKDRRRAGRLAHERVKEYNRTKQELQEAAAEAAKGQGVGSGNNSSLGVGGQQGVVQSQIVVRPLDIANALGPTE
ncbi:hypothetical protein PG994_000363 [Apiospora phragmitis]|uniref:Uncharacterized protein n=1 Tax=Apiospora phragmitis TaxID=2905665 RepID=A0ABR1X637_9PEZI